MKRKHPSGGRIQYKMKKTSEAVGVPIVDKATVILDRYDDRSMKSQARVFPILDGTIISTTKNSYRQQLRAEMSA